MLARLSTEVRQYLLITGNYWAFTLTDGALRMLVVLHFHQLGYSPLQVASLFLFYEIFGVITNLLGGWLGARIGLNRTMNIGLALQVVALTMLLVPAASLTVVWVMAAQAMSGIAKDLNKMSAKSSIKLLVPSDQQGALYRWVAALTGSKNALKGVGFFMGGALLTLVGFRMAVGAMAAALLLVWLASVALLRRDLGKATSKPRFRDLLSKSRAINVLSAARMFLFGARDIWFVVALPVFLTQTLGWDFWRVGGFMAAWVIGYGIVQASLPVHHRAQSRRRSGPGSGMEMGCSARRCSVRDGLASASRGQPRAGARHRARRVRPHVRGELVAAQLPDRGLCAERRGVAGCGLLLHGQRIGSTHRHSAVRLGLPAVGARRMSGVFSGLRTVGRCGVVPVGAVTCRLATPLKPVPR